MRIALISPKGRLYRHKGGIFRKTLRYQPLTLTTLAALVPHELDAEVTLLDEGIQEIPNQLDADIVGLTVITGTSVRAFELADHFRAQGITVVLGGPHVTLLPEEARRHADAICIGYAEDSWPQLLLDFAAGRLQCEYCQAADFTLQRPDMPFPIRNAFEPRHFLTQAVFEATRSCAHDCDFCVAPNAWGRRQYQKPVDWVVRDIVQFGQRQLIFIDLNLVSDKAYAKELFTAMLPLKVQWYGLATVLIAHDRELMELMARSGCKGLLLGFESVSNQSLDDANKSFNESVDYSTLVHDLHRLGISIQGCFAFGLEHDRPDVFRETADFVIDTGIDLPRFSIVTPFPGTPLHQRLASEGRILTRNWELYDGQQVVFQPKQMSPSELAAGHEWAWKAAYSHKAIARRLWKAHRFTPMAWAVNMGYRFYAHNLHRFYTCDWPISALPPRAGAIMPGHRDSPL